MFKRVQKILIKPLRYTAFWTLAIVLAPVAMAITLFKSVLYGIALLTPISWPPQEENYLRQAYARGIPFRHLRFKLWRSEKMLRQKAKELDLLSKSD